MKKGLYIVISGPSGVGKGTVCKKVMKEMGLEYSVSMTTRNMREGEVDGREYYFTTKEDFERRIKNNELLEYNIYNNNYYGTLKSEVIDKVNDGKLIICEIDVNGAHQVRDMVKDALLIYLAPPSMEELRNRLINRNTDDLETIEKRIKIAIEEEKCRDFYDYCVVNNNVDDTVEQIKEIIRNKQSNL